MRPVWKEVDLSYFLVFLILVTRADTWTLGGCMGSPIPQDGTSIGAIAGRLCLPAQSQGHGGDSSQVVTLEELDRAVEGL